MAGALKGRYLLLLMGIFAAFCGLCYNDFMAIPLWAPWGSCYDIEEYKVEINEVEETRHRFEEKPDCTYLIGIDPAWYISSNLLTFVNSFKMKLSVIIGVA